MIQLHVPKYDKHLKFEDFARGDENAARRTTKLDAEAELDCEEGRNPITGVWRLTESIRAH